MNFKKTSMLLFLIFILLFVGYSHANTDIGILTDGTITNHITSFTDYSQSKGYSVDIVTAWPNGQFKKEGTDAWIDLSDYKLLWLDISGNISTDQYPNLIPSIFLQPDCKKAIINYIKSGGVLIVSNLAFDYPVALGIETVRPDDWGQFDGNASVGYYFSVQNNFTKFLPEKIITGKGRHLFQWMRYKSKNPAKGKVIGLHQSDKKYKQIVQWDAGKGHIIALSTTLWLNDDNKALKEAGRFLQAIYHFAGIESDPEIVKYWKKKEELASKIKLQKEFDELMLTTVSQRTDIAPIQCDQPYAKITKQGFVIGNSNIERHVSLWPTIKTSFIYNKLTDELIPVGSSEFRITFGKEKQEINLHASAFKVCGKPTINEQNGNIKVSVQLEIAESPLLKVELIYLAQEKQISKSLKITNIGNKPFFLREIWLDTLRFDETVEIIPYTVFSVFARTEKGSLWLCQDLPYSIPLSDKNMKWIAVAYPYCKTLGTNKTYKSDSSYITAVKQTGHKYIPIQVRNPKIKFQFSTYGPFSDPQTPLDENEIESCLDFIDAKSPYCPKPIACHASYHDYGAMGYSDFIPYVKGPGGGFENIKKWLDCAHEYGLKQYTLYPDFGAWKDVPQAHKMLKEQFRPYAKSKGLELETWFSVYWKSWYSGVGLKDDKLIDSYGDPENKKWFKSFIINLLKRYDISILAPDQGVININENYDNQLGYLGTLPLSPYLYREYKAWDDILQAIRQNCPGFVHVAFHFGNNQIPLFSVINDFHQLTEPGGGLQQYKNTPDRQPALTEIKAEADRFRREQYWIHKERFLPLRLLTGQVNFQIDTSKYSEPTNEPIAQHFRYMLLQNIALHPNMVVWGIRTLDEKGFFGEKQKQDSRYWIDFMTNNLGSLSNRPFMPAGEPRYGIVEIYSYGDKGNGFVFLVNPNMISAKAEFALNEKSGFFLIENYAVRELSPYKRWITIDGKLSVPSSSNVKIEVPGYTVTLLQIQPVSQAWKGKKQIIAGNQIASNGKFLANPDDKINIFTFDINNPDKPKLIETISGKVPGVSPRIEIKDWYIKSDNIKDELVKGFVDGKLVHFEPSSEIDADFVLSNFAGMVLWDMEKDPVNDRKIFNKSDLLKDHKTGNQILSSKCFSSTDKTKGYWLCAEVDLSYVPRKSIMILQTALPEMVDIRVWINGSHQTCTRTFNDWAVLEPKGLSAGKNKVVLNIVRK